MKQTTGTGAALPPTTGQQYEGGIKHQRPGSRSMITAAVYDLAQQNVAVTDPDNANFEIAIGETRSRGAELQGRVSLTRGMTGKHREPMLFNRA